jgi:ribosomal protein L7/L12
VLAALVETIRSGHTIDAIKLAREKTGLGLRESKLLVDTLAKSALLR